MAQMTLDDHQATARRRGAFLGAVRAWLHSLRSVTLDQVLRVAAVLMLPLGIGAILLGWHGAAHTPFLFEQVPYLISGGLLGVGLLASGGLLYLASWLAQSAHMAADRDRHLQELMIEVRDTLRDLQAGRAAGVAATGIAAEAPAAWVATPSGTMFHRPDCRVVADRDDLRRVEQPADLRPCGLCDPAR